MRLGACPGASETIASTFSEPTALFSTNGDIACRMVVKMGPALALLGLAADEPAELRLPGLAVRAALHAPPPAQRAHAFGLALMLTLRVPVASIASQAAAAHRA